MTIKKKHEEQPGRISSIVATCCAVFAVIAIGVALWGWLTVFKLGGALQGMKKRQAMVMPTMTVDAVVVDVKPILSPEKYIGRIETIQKVDIIARVEGIMEKVHFTEGGMVKTGDLLFTIEADQYEAQLQIQKAYLAQANAALSQADKYFKRLNKADKRSVSQTDLDNAESALLQAQAEIKQANANISLAELNLSYTKIYAPIDGKIGKNFHTIGNLVSTSSGSLAKIVQLDPVRVLFSSTDKSYLKAMRFMKAGKISEMKSNLELPDGTRIKAPGVWSFVDNEMDAMTGTIAIRAQFDNSEELLIPGGYVNILISPKEVETNPVVPQSALLNDNKGYYVYVVDTEGTVSQRRIGIGKNMNGFLIVKSGIEAGEKVVIQGLQKIQPGQKVNINLVVLLAEGDK